MAVKWRSFVVHELPGEWRWRAYEHADRRCYFEGSPDGGLRYVYDGFIIRLVGKEFAPQTERAFKQRLYRWLDNWQEGRPNWELRLGWLAPKKVF